MKSQERKDAAAESDNYFEYDDVSYIFDDATGKELLYRVSEMAVICKLSFTPFSEETKLGYDFYKGALLAMSEDDKKFEFDGASYTIQQDGEATAMVLAEDGSDYVYISNMNMNSVIGGVFLTPDFKETAALAIEEGKESFEYTNADGETDTYLLSEKSGQHLIARNQETRVIDTYASPSKEHVMGTDANGMDLLARLMYGGRISLMIGFVVVFIEMVLGVIVGGISGYFGGWVDNVLMRLVDVIYCIPSMPLYLILGSIMDHYRATPTVRIYMLCVIMGSIGWVGIARIVRGQILSLREQDFMISAEASGLPVWRKIFKHLIPNVIPQLIVTMTLGLGSIILTEATLGYLNIGLPKAYATWGNMISGAANNTILTKYPNLWIAPGICIVLAVLAFNFIGDGLRDAFDPKSRR